MTPTRHLHAIIATIYAAIGQAYIGVSYLADDETRVIGELHLQDAAATLRECADRLEKLGEGSLNDTKEEQYPMTEQRATYHAGPDRPRTVKVRIFGQPDDVDATIEQMRQIFTILQEGEKFSADPGGIIIQTIIIAADEPKEVAGEQPDLFQSGS